MTTPQIEPLSLKTIIEDRQLQIRAELNKSVVQQYAECLEQLPPVIVFQVDRKGETLYLLADGYHRLAACKQRGLDTIRAEIRQGDEREARVYSLVANCKHGLPLTRDERRQAIEAFLKLETQRADTWIAKDLGVDHKTVTAARERLETNREIPYSASVLSEDGRWYDRERKERKQSAPAGQAALDIADAPETQYQEVPPPDPWADKVIHADCIEWLGQDTSQYDLVFTDPPYGILEEPWEPDDLLAFTRRWLQVTIPRIKPTGRLYICFSQRYMLDLKPLLDELAGTALTFGGVLIWNYRNVFNKKYSNMSYKPTFEPVFYWHGPDARPLHYDSDWNEERGDVWQIATPQSNFTDKKLHPAQKPLELVEGIIRTATQFEDSVLDPFGGAGTTAIAAQKLGRLWRVIEQDQAYVRIIRDRLSVFQKKV